jgi:hypothetical protein
MRIDAMSESERQIQELNRAVTALSSSVRQVQFNCEDPCDVARAANELQAAINEQAIGYADNPLIQRLAAEMRAQVVRQISDQACSRE